MFVRYAAREVQTSGLLPNQLGSIGLLCFFAGVKQARETPPEVQQLEGLSSPQSPDTLIFPCAAGTPMRGGNFLRHHVKPIANSLGIDAHLLTFQVLRRSFATRNQKRGSMKDVQEHLRHASIETTGNVYVQAIPESVRSMVEADIADVLSPGRNTSEHKCDAVNLEVIETMVAPA